MDIATTRVAIDLMAVEAILADESGHRMTLLSNAWSTFERSALDPDPLVQHGAHLEFHRSIWDASGNFLVLKLWPVVEANMTIALAQEQCIRDDPARAQAMHRQLMDAIDTRDPDINRQAFMDHTLASALELVALLDPSPGIGPSPL